MGVWLAGPRGKVSNEASPPRVILCLPLYCALWRIASPLLSQSECGFAQRIGMCCGGRKKEQPSRMCCGGRKKEQQGATWHAKHARGWHAHMDTPMLATGAGSWPVWGVAAGCRNKGQGGATMRTTGAAIWRAPACAETELMHVLGAAALIKHSARSINPA